MITIFNRKEVTTVWSLETCGKIERALMEHDIEYYVKTIDRSSPSIFAMGTRENSGCMFQDMDYNWSYVIYVKREDAEAARALANMATLR